MTESDREPATPSQRVFTVWPLISAAAALMLAGGLSAILFYRPNEPFRIDLAWMAEMVENRGGVVGVIAMVLNWLGGGVIGALGVPLGIIIALLLVRRRWAALFFALSVMASGGLVELLKQLVGRTRPEDMIVVSDYGSFPSGHTANAATMAVVLGLVFGRTWLWAAGLVYTALMAISRTYLGAHWLSDTIGGVLIGAAVAVIIWAPLARRLKDERRPRCGESIPPLVG
jgi:undecaprenyl-diphosphatase